MERVDADTLKNLLNGKEVVYKFLREVKGYFLDPMNFRTNSTDYLDQVLKKRAWAPND